MRFTDYSIKALYETVWSGLVILAIGILLSKSQLDRVSVVIIFVICLVNFMLSSVITTYYAKIKNYRELYLYGFAFVGACIILISAFYFMRSFEPAFQVAAMVICGYLWKRGALYRLSDVTHREARKGAVVHAGLGLIVFFLPPIQSSEHFSMLLDILLPGLIILTLVYLALITIDEVFVSGNDNHINRSKNIKRFKHLAILLAIITTFVLQFKTISSSLISFISSIYNWVVNVFLMWLLYPFLRLIFGWIDTFNEQRKIAFSESKQGRLVNSDSFETGIIDDYIPDYSQAAFYLEWVVKIAVALVLVLLMVKVLRYLMKTSTSTIGTEVTEEKNFVFSKKDLLELIANPFKHLKKQFVMSDRYELLKKLHPVRRLYISILLSLMNKGIVISKANTPKELADQLEHSIPFSDEFSRLTQFYEVIRYGKTELDDAQQKEFENIWDVAIKEGYMDGRIRR